MKNNRQKSIEKKNHRGLVKKKIPQRTYLLYGLGIGAMLGGGYLLYNYWRNRASLQRELETSVSTLTPSGAFTTTLIPSVTINRNEFPLRKGASGVLVKEVQKALLAMTGKPSLIIRETSFKNGQPDGIFGSGTEHALRAAGYPTALTENSFSTLIAKNTAVGGSEAGDIAREVIEAANKQNLFGVLSGLKKIPSVEGYKRVSMYFQNIRVLGIRVTSLVNALLSVAFKDKELEKEKIRAEFSRMGLKQQPDGVWYIPASGPLGNFDDAYERTQQEWQMAMAYKATLLRSGDGTFIVPEVLPNTVIGYVTGNTNGVTRILTQSGETVFSPSRNIITI